MGPLDPAFLLIHAEKDELELRKITLFSDAVKVDLDFTSALYSWNNKECIHSLESW